MSIYILYKDNKIINVVNADIEFIDGLKSQSVIDSYIDRDSLPVNHVLKINRSKEPEEFESFISDPNSSNEYSVDFRDVSAIAAIVSKLN